jgi:hypothetical protein
MDWIYLLAAWMMILLITWNIWAVIRDITTVAQKMHEIPCANCQFYTGSYYLKCPVHPQAALTKEAVGCIDYQG